MSVPTDLRVCLESCLSNPPSQATLERHLPDVRQIIIGLLHGLRDKQRQYREGVAARRAREANGKGKGTALPPSVSASSSSGLPLTPNSAGRSREDLRRFVSQAAQASTVPEDAVAARRYSNRSAGSDVGSAAGSQDSRLSAALSSRLSGNGNGPVRSGSMRDSSRSSRQAFDPQDAFAPPAAAPAQPRMPRNDSAASIESARSAASATTAPSQRGPPVDRSRMASPPPPSRRADDAVPSLPQTPTVDAFGSVIGAPSPIPSTVIRPPSVASVASSMEDPHAQQAQAASLEALKASDNLSRRASKRYSAYAIQKMTSPTPGSSSPSPGGGVSSPSHERGPNRARTGDLYRAGSGSSAGRELASADVRRSKSEHSSRGGHGRTSSRATSGPAPAVPPIPRSYSSQADLRAGGGQASPIPEEDEAQSSPAPSVRSPPPDFPPPPVPGNGDVPPSTSSSSLRAAEPRRSPSPALPSLPPDSSSSSSTAAPSTTPRHPPPPSPPSPSSPPPEPEYPCSIFLQIGRDVKKARLTGPPDVQSLRQLFVERFGFNPGMASWPGVYLRDTDAGVHYELEDMSEVRAGSVLSLNVDSASPLSLASGRGEPRLTDCALGGTLHSRRGSQATH